MFFSIPVITVVLFFMSTVSFAELPEDISFGYVGAGTIIHFPEPIYFEAGSDFKSIGSNTLSHCSNVHGEVSRCLLTVGFRMLKSDVQRYRSITGSLYVHEFNHTANDGVELFTSTERSGTVVITCRKRVNNQTYANDCSLGEFRTVLGSKGITVTTPEPIEF